MTNTQDKNKVIKKAKIADVVSDYMKLSPRGSDFIGYCPFHTGKTETLYINTSNNTYSCHECGESGSTVDFLMNILKISYDEALAFLAKRYGIKMSSSPQERSEAESLFEANEYACQYYQKQLTDTEAGRNIALSYYKQVRGFSDEIISKFKLGYSPARHDNKLINDAINAGFTEEEIVKSGIGVKYENSSTYDRFHERITFPITNLAGRVIAFSCRTMKSDEQAKYKNTNDTSIYTKGNEVFGLFEARESILKEDKCILVEGNADVVSMHQAGFTYTIAPLGTGFTINQARTIRRFTKNIILLFDGDNAGHHANEIALEHFLPLGIMPSIVLLPDGEDPDSFARKHSFDEACKFITDNTISLVQFYIRTKLNGDTNNVTLTTNISKEICKKIALIPNVITRSNLAKETSYELGILEKNVLDDISKQIAVIREENFKKQQMEAKRQQFHQTSNVGQPPIPDDLPPFDEMDQISTDDSEGESLLTSFSLSTDDSKNMHSKEQVLMHYVAKYGMVYFGEHPVGDNDIRPQCLIEYIDNEFKANGLTISTPSFRQIFELGISLVPEFYKDLDNLNQSLEESKAIAFREGTEKIQNMGLDFDSIQHQEKLLEQQINLKISKDIEDFRKAYFERYLCNHPNREIRSLSIQLVDEPFRLSKIHTQYAAIKTEYDCLDVNVQDAINNLRFEIINNRIGEVQNLLKTERDNQKVLVLLQRLQELHQHRSILASYLGDRVINPTNK